MAQEKWGSTGDAAKLLGISRQALSKQLYWLEHEGVARRGGYRWQIDLQRIQWFYDNSVGLRIDSPRMKRLG